MLLAVDQLAKAFGDRVLFEGLGFHVAPGQKVALIARNGTGKTSLLRILAGKEAPDAGTVSFHPEARVGYLEQEPHLGEGSTILEAVFAADYPPLQAVRAYEAAVLSGDSGIILEQALAGMEQHAAWDLEARVKEILFRLDLRDVNRIVDTLSGGERKRVALARVLLEEPDLLILDEPTNHLDLGMVEWLEDHLDASKQALLLVTHDRYFLDRLCDEILELDGGTMYRYRGNYADFLEKKAARQASDQKSLEKAKGRYKTELEWARRMPKARTTKSKYRMDAVQALRAEATKRLEEDNLELEIQMERLGSKILELHRVRKSHGDRVLIDGVDYKFQRRDRIGIVGPNGSGKSTLLDIMTGDQEPDGGKVIRGETLLIGHYRQEGGNFPDEWRVIDAVREVAEFIPLSGGRKLTAGQLLEQFLFDRNQQYQQIGTLSGGERRRLYLLTILMRNPNFLILDEPTNDLDLITLGILEDFLLQYPGCLVIVSHDRYFMDKLVDHCFVYEGGGYLRDFPGNYSAYRSVRDEEEASLRLAKEIGRKTGSPSAPAAAPKPTVSGEKLSYKEQREYNQLEVDIAALESQKSDLETLLAGSQLDHEQLMANSEALGKAMNAIDEKTERWLVLAERV